MPKAAKKKVGEKAGKAIKISLVIIAMLFCFFLVNKIHTSYPYDFIEPESATLVNSTAYHFPFHNDEWAHLAMGLAIAKEKKLNFNPYLAQPSQDREIGFHLFLSRIFSIPGIDPVLAYAYLAPIFLAINALLLFFLVLKLSKNYWAGLFSMFFLAAIKSNMNILGNWFFVPSTLTLSLIFLFFYSAVYAFEEGKSKEGKPAGWLLWVLAAIIFIIILFIYPFAAVLVAITAFIYALTKLGIIKKHWKPAVFFIILAAMTALFFIKLYFWTGTLAGTFARFFSELVFKQGWTVIEYTYSLMGVYGAIPLLLAAIGTFYVISRKKNTIFIIWPGLAIINLLIFSIFKFSLFLPYQRNYFYLLVSLAPLSAFGLAFLCEQALTFSKKHILRKKNHSIALCTIIAIIILMLAFHNYYKTEPERFSLQRIITPADYDALLWLKESYPPYQKVLAKPFLSAATYPVSQSRAVGIIPSSLEGGAYGKIYDFFNGGCDIKKAIVEEERIDFILSPEEINCAFAGKVYYKDGVTLYRVI